MEVVVGNELDVTSQMVEGPSRTRYPWKALTKVGTFFTISVSNSAGATNCRQLCYAANMSQKRKNSSIRFQATKNSDGSVKVRRIF